MARKTKIAYCDKCELTLVCCTCAKLPMDATRPNRATRERYFIVYERNLPTGERVREECESVQAGVDRLRAMQQRFSGYVETLVEFVEKGSGA